jgi:predicted nucleic acid-binding protein
MTNFPVVLDACVLFPAIIRDSLLRAAEAGLYRVHWSQQILDETTRNLIERGKLDARQAQYLIAEMSRAFPDAMVEVPPESVIPITNDLGDRHVVAAAVVANAKVIVTDNLKHFLPTDLQPWNLEAKSPDNFLTQLYELDPEIMVEVVRSQAQDRQKPIAMLELLDTLKKRLPQLAAKVQPHFF